MPRILVIDNYDSFTWNLVHLIGPLATAIAVVRNDETTADAVLREAPDAVILSPGPCTPTEAGACLSIVTEVGPSIPILGVCLGLQTIGQALGGSVVRAPAPMHGKVSDVHHGGRALFAGLPNPFRATRYHSLIVDRNSCPADLEITAETADGLVMGVSHRHLPLHGVQFHPESILSEHGEAIARNFLAIAARWGQQKCDDRVAGAR